MPAAIYARVWTKKAETEMQSTALRQYLERGLGTQPDDYTLVRTREEAEQNLLRFAR